MRLIDATKLEEIWRKQKARDQYNGGGYMYSPQDILDDIEEAETIDPASIRPKGEWRFQRGCYEADECTCSVCGQLLTTHAKERANFCPNCGADMRGAADDR